MASAKDYRPDEMGDFGLDEPIQKSTKRKGSAKNKKEEEPVIVHDDDEFYKKWAGPLIIGPFIPALFAIMIIVSGQIVLNTWTGTCGYALNSFVSAAIATCYLFLLIYTWIFVGTKIRIVNITLGVDMTVLTPFKSLRYLMMLYIFIGVLSFIVWIVGTALLNLSIFCEKTSPLLYNYSKFLVGIYWAAFVIYIVYGIKLLFGRQMVKLFKEAARESTVDEVEEKLFKREFSNLDPEDEGHITREQVPKLLEALGVFVPEQEQTALLQTFDPDNTGLCKFDVMAAWFRKLNAEMNEKLGPDDDDDDEESEVGRLFGGKNF